MSFWPGHLALLWTLFDSSLVEFWSQWKNPTSHGVRCCSPGILLPLPTTFYCSISFTLSSLTIVSLAPFLYGRDRKEIQNWSMLFLNFFSFLRLLSYFNFHLFIIENAFNLYFRIGGYKLWGLESLSHLWNSFNSEPLFDHIYIFVLFTLPEVTCHVVKQQNWKEKKDEKNGKKYVEWNYWKFFRVLIRNSSGWVDKMKNSKVLRGWRSRQKQQQQTDDSRRQWNSSECDSYRIFITPK